MSIVVNRVEKKYTGRVFTLATENVTLDNGVTIDIDVIRHPGAAAIVPVLDDREIVLIRQYRHAVGGYIWEIPAGTLDENETPLSCAKRELIEETGFSAEDFRNLGKITPVPGYSDECIHIFLATGLKPAVQKLDEDEVLNVHRMKIEQVMEMIDSGRIQDSKTLNGLLLAHRALEWS